jgi:hypothetical protein
MTLQKTTIDHPSANSGPVEATMQKRLIGLNKLEFATYVAFALLMITVPAHADAVTDAIHTFETIIQEWTPTIVTGVLVIIGAALLLFANGAAHHITEGLAWRIGGLILIFGAAGFQAIMLRFAGK